MMAVTDPINPIQNSNLNAFPWSVADKLAKPSSTKEDADTKTRLYLEYVIGLTSEEVEEIADKIKSFYEGAEI
jgi:hypothetical protein